MEQVADIVMFMFPAIAVIATTIYLLNKYLDEVRIHKSIQLRETNSKTVLPIRLQAYERLVLYLERINPNNSIMRLHKSGMSASKLQQELIKSIRDEFDHNMAQQVYVSIQAWNMVKQAKEEIVNLINLCANKVGDQATGIDLSGLIFETLAKSKTHPTNIASNYLKQEIKEFW